MKTLIGTTGRAVRRRWADLTGLVVMTLSRDQFAEEPGDSVVLHLAGRTHYRASAIVLDEFLRDSLGDAYAAPAGFDPLTLLDATITASPGEDGLLIHSTELPRDQWAEATILTLDSGGDSVTVGLAIRQAAADEDVDGYRAQVVVADGDPTLTRLVKVEAGVETTLDEVETPWVAGDVLAVSAEWNRLRIYRSGILVLDVIDASSPFMATLHAGLQIVPVGAATASLGNFVAGAWRQEYVGLIADRGDASMSLGLVEPTASPATFAISIINCAPVGGEDRFAALIRHGLNT